MLYLVFAGWNYECEELDHVHAVKRSLEEAQVAAHDLVRTPSERVRARAPDWVKILEVNEETLEHKPVPNELKYWPRGE